MKTFLTARRTRGAAAVLAVTVIVAGSPSARADFLVRTFANDAPAAARSPLQGAALPQFARGEPLTIDRPHEDSVSRPRPELDEATLAVVHALLVCAIPPPITTPISSPPAPPPAPPEVPPPPGVSAIPPSVPPPPFIPPTGPSGSVPQVPPVPTTGGTSESPPEAPEPATLLLALVGSGLTGAALWRQRRGQKQRRALAA